MLGVCALVYKMYPMITTRHNYINDQWIMFQEFLFS